MSDTFALAEEIVARATSSGERIATAESLTGGLLAAALVAIPGASQAFSGGVVAYDTRLKAAILGVDEALLRDRGPVDAEVARQMAIGVRSACAISSADGVAGPVPASIGVATTGVAGPDPDPQTGQPAGTVWVAISTEGGTKAELVAAPGETREEVRGAALVAALLLVLEYLRSLD
ncbi:MULTISPECIES: CinA family protein [Leucobacter]|uniref:CinA family protein n=1 Tax=Leucobacter TaxID=55968 RepID=UPI000E653232|nr:CinA family protein [Leucobacter aridicollis]UTX52274.1 CinA family protein [Leucobacter aridicollis]